MGYFARHFLILLVTALAYSAAPAHAQCIAGLPCVTNLEPNDPEIDTDGPNLLGKNKSKSESAACDADFMNQIYARSYLEAEREVVMASVGIDKPDSVLELTCFDQVVTVGMEEILPIFGQTTGPEATETLGSVMTFPEETSVDQGDIEALTIKGFTEYLKSNFEHAFLGRDASSGNLDYETGSTSSYNCIVMDSIHKLSRCLDFRNDGNMFLSFETLATTDPRVLPALYKCGGTKITDDLIGLSENVDRKHVSFDIFNDFIELAEGDTCGDPIDTGLEYDVVTVTGGTSYFKFIPKKTETFEHQVCTNPICYYDAEDKSCKKK